MSVLIHAHGFSLSDSLENACINEVKNRLEPLHHAELNARWNLFKDGHDWVAFLSWHERRQLQGNVRIRSDDLYKSISLAGKVAEEQMNQQHHRHDRKHLRRNHSQHSIEMEGDVL